MPLFSVGQYISVWTALLEKQPILALMKSLDRLSVELEWRKHANSALWQRALVSPWIAGLAGLLSVEVHRWLCSVLD